MTKLAVQSSTMATWVNGSAQLSELSRDAYVPLTLFNVVLERQMTDVLEEHTVTNRMGGRTITNF